MMENMFKKLYLKNFFGQTKDGALHEIFQFAAW